MAYSCLLYPTIITPFTSCGEIDYESLEKLIAFYARVGVDGIFAVCQSSEMFFLSDAEKLELAAFSIAKCRENVIKCVVSGHTQDGIEEQICYLKELEKLKPDAVILVNNRFAAREESEETALTRFYRVTDALSKDTRLGVYECPYPYKRKISKELISAMKQDGRFDFIKDTCCEIGVIRERLALLALSGIALYNANAATLYDSLLSGAAGYSGVMLNIIPEYFALLKQALTAEEPNLTVASLAAQDISAMSVIECQNYPANAKYALMKRGLLKTAVTRNGKPPLTESQRKEMDSFLMMAERERTRLLPHARVSELFPAGSAFPSCHASCVLNIGKRTLCVYFAGSYEKADDVGIWLSVRRDGSWEKPRLLAKVDEIPHWNPVIYEIPGGVRVTFKAGKEISGWTSWRMESHDGGDTWTDPVPYGDAVGPVRSKPLRLMSGDLLAPNSVETDTTWRPRVDISTDDGKTYRKLSDIPLPPMSGKGAIQPTLWESAPGRVHALLRTTEGFIYRSDSVDGGKSWCEAYNTGLPNNNSGIDVCYYKGKLYLALNPVSGNWAARTPLAIMVSEDNGESFTTLTVLEDALMNGTHGAEFSYPSLHIRDDLLRVSYTKNRETIGYAEIKIE